MDWKPPPRPPDKRRQASERARLAKRPDERTDDKRSGRAASSRRAHPAQLEAPLDFRPNEPARLSNYAGRRWPARCCPWRWRWRWLCRWLWPLPAAELPPPRAPSPSPPLVALLWLHELQANGLRSTNGGRAASEASPPLQPLVAGFVGARGCQHARCGRRRPRGRELPLAA